MGKTALATNIAFNAARAYRTEISPAGDKTVVDGAVVAFFSLEMSAEQLATRILAERTEISSHKIRQESCCKRNSSAWSSRRRNCTNSLSISTTHPPVGIGRPYPGPPPGPHQRARPDRHRLSAAARRHRRQAKRKPGSGNFGHHPQPEGPGQGTEGSGARPVPAVAPS